MELVPGNKGSPTHLLPDLPELQQPTLFEYLGPVPGFCVKNTAPWCP